MHKHFLRLPLNFCKEDYYFRSCRFVLSIDFFYFAIRFKISHLRLITSNFFIFAFSTRVVCNHILYLFIRVWYFCEFMSWNCLESNSECIKFSFFVISSLFYFFSSFVFFEVFTLVFLWHNFFDHYSVLLLVQFLHLWFFEWCLIPHFDVYKNSLLPEFSIFDLLSLSYSCV